jgi:prepilin peptidase CpaA
MLTEAIKLMWFPAIMAFAASSDLFTMTIANRVSLIVIGGFGLLAILTGITTA